MSSAIDRPDISRSSDLAEVKTRPLPPQQKAQAVRDVKPTPSNPFALVETKAKVGKELESNYKEIEAALEDIRKMADDNLSNLGFSIDRKINTHVVVVTDKTTGEVVRQIPNEVVIRVAHNIADLKGLLFDKKL
jgi:flagellar protein FlaG